MIYIDRLHEGKVEPINTTIAVPTSSTEGEFLSFAAPIEVSGEAYLADEFLVLHLNLKTTVRMVCKICSEDILREVEMSGVYITEEITKIPSKTYDPTKAIYDMILIEIPSYQECDGNCPGREDLKAYLKN